MVSFSWQLVSEIAAQTLRPETGPVDSGNDPIFTAIFFVLFVSILIGSGIAGFKFRMRRMRRAEKEAEDKVKQEAK